MYEKKSKKMRKRLPKKVNPQEDRFTRGKWSWEDLNLRVLPSAALWPIYICRQITQPELQLQKKPTYNDYKLAYILSLNRSLLVA